jgi:hypothetical protein
LLELEKWARESTGFGGKLQTFDLMLDRQIVKAAMVSRSFTSGIATSEISCWKISEAGECHRTLFLGVFRKEIRCIPSRSGCVLEVLGNDHSSWNLFAYLSSEAIISGTK